MSKSQPKHSEVTIKQVVLFVLVIAVIGLFAVFKNNNYTDNKKLTDTQIRNALGCDRTTEEIRPTDILCLGGSTLYKDLYSNKPFSMEDYIADQKCERKFIGSKERTDACRVYLNYQKWQS